jgi:hypothetical protein
MLKVEKLILKELDPTGVTIKTYSMKFETSDGDSMKDYRFLLTVGKYEYYMNHEGLLIPIIPNGNNMEETIGTSGKIVDLFNKELTQEEWNALAIIHRMTKRLNIGVRFDWDKSIDVRSENTSQIVDESVFLSKEK